MDYEKIVSQVYQELEKRLMLEKESNKKRLAVVGEFASEEYSSLREVFQIVPYSQAMDSHFPDCVIIEQLPLAMMGNLATGCGTQKDEEWILRILLEGKKVYLLEKGLIYKRYKKTAFKPLYNLYTRYEDKLIQYGFAIIAQPTDILYTGIDGESRISAVVKEETDFLGKKLLLESDLQKRQVRGQSEIRISKDCIITPLAEDYIKYRNLTVKKL